MISKSVKVRIARPTDNLKDIQEMYIEGLGFKQLGAFVDHNGFDGAIIGHEDNMYHLEFTHHQGTVVGKAPSQDNLLVFYISDQSEWEKTCDAMLSAGFIKVDSYNPYWDNNGSTYEDIDGYRVVLQNDEWCE